MVKYFKDRPMLLCGIIGSVLCVIGFHSVIFVFFAAIFFIGIFFALLIKRAKPAFVFVSAFLILISTSVILTSAKADKTAEYAGNYVSGDFIVTTQPENRGSYSYAVFEANGCDGLKNGTRIAVFLKNSNLSLGDIITANIKLKAIDDKYKAMDYADKIYITGNVKGTAVKKNESDPILSFVGKLRNYITNTLFSNMDYKEAATLNAIVYGDKSYISDEFYGHIKAAGVSHVMVVSGMHLAIIVSLATYLCEKFVYNGYLKSFVIFMTVLFMAALCGFTKSIVRAGVCYIIYAVGLAFKRDNTPENTLGAAVSLIFIVSPFTVFSVSFRLSALSTLGIVAAASPVNKALEERGIIKHRSILALISAVTVTMFALIFTLPVTVYYFGYISSVSVITNLLIAEAVTVALTVTVIGLVLYAVIPVIGEGVLAFAGIAAKYINFVIDYFGSLDFAVISFGKYAFPISVILLSAVLFALFACQKRADMLKLKEINEKIVREGGKKLIWR
mgnify:CR=1 FL=1